MQVPETLTDLELERGSSANGNASSFTIERANIAAFGHFREIEFETLAPGINLFFGHNEAGKTTIFSFFYSMLFGIYPTSPDKHPYYPRESRHLHGEMWYRYGGRNVWVERKLMSSATGKMEIDGRQQNLGQNSLPEADFLSKEVFASVFALNLDDLVAPARSKAWDDIQDRLLGGMNMDFLRSARVVADELASDAGTIWRPDRRGKQTLRELESERNKLGGQIRFAKNRNEEIRNLVGEIATMEGSLEELRKTKEAVSSRLAKLRRLLPASIALKRLEEWKKEAGDVPRYAHLPADPLEAIARLDRDIEELAHEIRKKEVALDECRRVQESVTDADRAIVERAAAIQQWGRNRGTIEAWQVRISELENETSTACTRRDAEAERILSSGWSDDIAPLLDAISTADLRAAVKAYADAKQVADQAQQKAADARWQERERETTPWLVGVAAVVGTAIAAGALGQYLAAILMLLAAIYFGVRFEEARRYNRRLQENDESEAVAERERIAELRRKDVETIVGDLPVPSPQLASPSPGLASDVETMKRLAEDADRHQKPARDLRDRLNVTAAELEKFAADAGVAYTNVEATIETLLESHASSSDRVLKAENAARRQRELGAELAVLQEKREKHTNERASLIASLEEIGGSAAEGAAILTARRNAAKLAERDAQDLRQTYGSIEDIDAEVRQAVEDDPELFSDGTEERLEDECGRLSEEIEDLVVAKTECEKDLEKLEDLPLLHHLESEDLRLLERINGQKRERDRLTVLARIVREADERFRRRHQPDVIQRASAYFNSLTGGRYEGMMLEDEKLSLLPSNGSGIEIDEEHNWTSRGTRDQIFLSIRLALIDHLDAHHARLPVFLDEVFVNWDRKRRKAGLELLQEIAGQRQVFLFTCHEWFRDEVMEQLPATIITLD